MKFIIDKMMQTDWEQVIKIYEQGIKTGIATFQTTIPSWEEWNNMYLKQCRLVARSGDKILGWVALISVSKRAHYHGVAELSIYIGNEYKGMGVGKALLEALIKSSEKEGFWSLQAVVIDGNLGSVKLHESCGFRQIGYREKMAIMPHTGKWLNVILMERRSEIIGI